MVRPVVCSWSRVSHLSPLSQLAGEWMVCVTLWLLLRWSFVHAESGQLADSWVQAYSDLLKLAAPANQNSVSGTEFLLGECAFEEEQAE